MFAGALGVRLWTRCECAYRGVFGYSSLVHLLSNWPPEAQWAGREAEQLTPPTLSSPPATWVTCVFICLLVKAVVGEEAAAEAPAVANLP